MPPRRRHRGEGTVFYDRDTRGWVALLSLGTHDGHRVRRKTRAATEQGARAALEQLRRQHAAGGSPASGTLGTYLRDWLREHGASVRPSTRATYETHIRVHIDPLIGGYRLSKLQAADVRHLIVNLQQKRLSPAYITRVVTTLRIALNAAMADRTLLDNPADRIKLPRASREPVRALTVVDADQIVEAVRGHWCEYVVRLLLGSGMRLGEAIGLDQGDLMLDKGYVRLRVTKTKVRAANITGDASDALHAALALAPRHGPHEPVFFGHRGKGSLRRLRRDSVSQVFPNLMAAAGLPHLTPHGLRHAAATIMLTAGIPMRAIADQLGHANPALTARTYAHVVPEMQEAAIAALERRTGTR